MYPICIENTNIDNKNKSIDENNNKNNCFQSCFKKKENKIYPFYDFIDNFVNIKIYHYNTAKFLKYYNNKKYYKIIEVDIKDINNFDIYVKDVILDFITECITKILERYNISKINSISNNLTIFVFEKIYETHKKLNTITE
jgi:hypothetical protein